jgi:hypothetical protein
LIFRERASFKAKKPWVALLPVFPQPRQEVDRRQGHHDGVPK